MSSEAERFALNDQLVRFVAAKTLSVQIADNVYTGTANATAFALPPPLFIDGENSRVVPTGTVKMHLNPLLCKKIWRDHEL
jgi:hypothetical protein